MAGKRFNAGNWGSENVQRVSRGPILRSTASQTPSGNFSARWEFFSTFFSSYLSKGYFFVLSLPDLFYFFESFTSFKSLFFCCKKEI